MKFIICAPPYKTNSVGLVVLHVLARLLRELGEQAVVYDSISGLQPANLLNPEGVPYLSSPAEPEDIVILPEILSDDWWQTHSEGALKHTKQRVWYLLNRPLFLTGKPLTYLPQDYILSYADFIDDSVPTMPIILSQPHLFHPPAVPKPGNIAAVYYGKWVGEQEVPELTEFLQQFSVIHKITRTWPPDRKELARLLQEASVLVTFDCLTGMIGEALACHTPALMMEDHFQLQYYGLFEIRECGIFREPHQFAQAKLEVPSYAPRLAKAVEGNNQRVQTFIHNVKAHFAAMRMVQDGNSALNSQLKSLAETRRQFDLLRYEIFQSGKRFSSQATQADCCDTRVAVKGSQSRRISLSEEAGGNLALSLDVVGSNRVREFIFGPLANIVWPARNGFRLSWESHAGLLDLHAIKLLDSKGEIIDQWPDGGVLLTLGEGTADLPGGKMLVPWRVLGSREPHILIHAADSASTPRAVSCISFQLRVPAIDNHFPLLTKEFQALKNKAPAAWRSKPIQQWSSVFTTAFDKLSTITKKPILRSLVPSQAIQDLANLRTKAAELELAAPPDICGSAWRNAAQQAVALLQRVRQSPLGKCVIKADLLEKCQAKLFQADALANEQNAS